MYVGKRCRAFEIKVARLEDITTVPVSHDELRRVFVQDEYALLKAGVRGVTKGLAGAATTVAASTECVGALGFTPSGIGAGTPAALMMSWSAIANGGAVPARGAVAFLQSLGAVGLGAGVCAGVGAAFAACAASFEVFALLDAIQVLGALLKDRNGRIARNCTVASHGGIAVQVTKIEEGNPVAAMSTLGEYLMEHKDVHAIAVVDGTVIGYHDIRADEMTLTRGQAGSNVILLLPAYDPWLGLLFWMVGSCFRIFIRLIGPVVMTSADPAPSARATQPDRR